MAKKKIEKEFRVTVANCGTSHGNSSYPKISGKNALEVCNEALTLMLKSMVGVDNIYKSLYLLSVYNLRIVLPTFQEKFPELKDDDFEKYLKIYAIKEDN